jgi:hypothetical protein
VRCRPRAIFDVFVAGNNQPGPRLANGNDFHAHYFRMLTA